MASLQLLDSDPYRGEDAEVLVLGALLNDPRQAPDAFALLTPEHFYRDPHRRIFAAAQAVFERGGPEPLDLISVSLELRDRDEYELCGEFNYLHRLTESAPWATNLPYWAGVLRQEFLRRQVAATGEEMVRDAGLEAAPEEILQEAQQRLLELGQRATGEEGTLLAALLHHALEDAESQQAHQGSPSGVPSGFASLDRQTSGFQAGDLVIVAARPSMGKTSFCVGAATHAASRKVRTLIFSLEMSREQLTQSIICREAGVDSQKWRNGLLDHEDWDRMAGSLEFLERLPLLLDDTPALTIGELRARALRHHQREPLGLIVLDYLQLCRGSSRRAEENRVQEISEITRGLKALARELGCPVMAAAQLNRAVEQRSEKRPQLSDLRESGEIEATADVVLGLYRPNYYTKDDLDPLKPDEAEILILKQRNGPTGTVTLGFVPAWRKFVTLSAQPDPPPARRDLA